MPTPPSLAPLESLFDRGAGDALPLPLALATLYGALRFPRRGERPHVIANFVETLDGVVALDDTRSDGGAPISGGSAQDRAVMGLLRAVADAVVAGAGTLAAVPRHRWTAEHIYPPLGEVYRALRASLGEDGPPLNVIVSASGDLDLTLPVFASGEVPALIVTSEAGAQRLRERGVPEPARVAAMAPSGPVTAADILRAVGDATGSAAPLVLVEGGPRLIATFFAERLVDELFLTLAPQMAGRDAQTRRLSLVEGAALAPERPAWGRLVSVKRGGELLFLRYAFGEETEA